MTNREIHDFFRAAGMTEEGTDGFMGNLASESAMNPQNVEDRSGLRDEDYTFRVDNDPSYDFCTDYGAYYGYGYAQWTDSKRKSKLLAFARSRGKSIGDPLMQLQFSVLELQNDFPTIFNTLCTSHDLYECTKLVCEKYEIPAIPNVGDRYELAKKFYNEFAVNGSSEAEHDAVTNSNVNKPTPATRSDAGIKAAVIVMQMIMSYAGYWGAVTGERSPEFFEALHTFTADLEKAQ